MQKAVVVAIVAAAATDCGDSGPHTDGHDCGREVRYGGVAYTSSARDWHGIRLGARVGARAGACEAGARLDAWTVRA
jgi:hypothetical protein